MVFFTCYFALGNPAIQHAQLTLSRHWTYSTLLRTPLEATVGSIVGQGPGSMWSKTCSAHMVRQDCTWVKASSPWSYAPLSHLTSLTKHKSKLKLLRISRWRPQSISPQAWHSSESGAPSKHTDGIPMKPALIFMSACVAWVCLSHLEAIRGTWPS